MTLEQLLHTIRAFDNVFDLAPVEGSDAPEIAWGDHFFYYAPDANIPKSVQPYATIVTKDYPGDEHSRLNPIGRWRVSIQVGPAKFTALTGETTGDFSARDFSVADVIMPHPVYGALGWIAVVNPGPRTENTVIDLLHAAHDDARRRLIRRSSLTAEGESATDR
ncbi:DUF6194 family protein [Cryobacterium sp. M91]|uniref:DUF6194 family protein n=1 Tax=Cryobacterium sp. M91 TaxID=2048294 RepID=UPI000CE3514B|nr:DUF6194 family protein [Cryobacterium sp. M91]